MPTSTEAMLTLTLTKDDIANIHNAELLTFLEEYSAENTNQEQKKLDDKEYETPSEVQEITQNATSSYVNHNKEAKWTHSAKCDKSASESIDLENEIARLQTDIETFITAVDEDGRHYNICLNTSGSVNVPINESMQTDFHNKEEYQYEQEQQENEESESETYEENEQNNFTEQKQSVERKNKENLKITNNNDKEARQDEYETQQFDNLANIDDINVEAEVNNSSEQEEELQHTEEKENIEERNLHVEEPLQLTTNSNTTLSESFINEKESRSKQRKELTQRSNSTALLQERFRRKPKYAVRSRDVLRDDEQKRVETLLDEANVSTNAETPNPYVYSNAVQSRLSEIDEKLLQMQEARHYKHVHSEESHDDSLCTEHMSTVDVTLSSNMSTCNNLANKTSPRISHDLGNSYLTLVRQRQRRLHKLRSINEQLQRIHEEAERANMFSYTDVDNYGSNKEVKNNIYNVRPQWYNDQRKQIITYTTLQGDNFTANEESVQKMVDKAREEHDNTIVKDVESKVTPNPYSSLIEEVHAALNRAKTFM